MNPPQNTPQGSTTVNQTNHSFPPALKPAPSQPSAAPERVSSKKAARIARVRERLTGPPSPADGRVPTKELILENRLRARVAADSDEEAARRIEETARTIARTWKDFGGGLLEYPRSTPPEERRPLPALPDNAETSTDD